MNPTQPRALPLHGLPLVLICLVYLLAGLIDHDPWKPDDAVHLGVAWEFAQHGDWLTPRLADSAWFGSPPLYHWVAALLGQAFEFTLPFHAGARLASALFGALALLAIGGAVRTLHGPVAARGTPLLLIGTLGLLTPIHDAQPAIALLAAQALLLFGLARMAERPLASGLTAALGVGLGIFAQGSPALPLLTLPLLLTPLHPQWRSRRALGGIALALLLGLLLAGLWPALLAWQAPAQLDRWIAVETGRMGFSHLNAENLQDHFELLAWGAWPLLPLGLWALWGYRRQLGNPAFFLPLLASLLALAQVLLIAEPHPIQHLPLYIPLALLAAAGVEKLRRGAANAFDWFGTMTFTLVAGLIWLGGVSMITGEPARVAKNFLKAEPGFVAELSWPALIAAALLTACWAWAVTGLAKSPWRSVTHWAAGMALTWGLIATLWMPWIDYGKTYRPVADSLQKALAGSDECVAARGLGDPQRASLRYFIDLKLRTPRKSRDCGWLLVQGGRVETQPAGWRKVWEGNRPGDKNERLRLYRRS
jgi:4-amino-4-deoxy-L-arabinose transferase-like glycosyltransferase